jgi:hypothetical protein
MNHELQRFGNKLKLYALKEEESKYYKDLAFNDIQWGASHLFAELLLQSKRKTQKLDRNKVEKMVANFNKANRSKVDVCELVDKCWIRFILDEVRVPSEISSAISDLKRSDKFNLSLLSALKRNSLTENEFLKGVLVSELEKIETQENPSELLETYFDKTSLREEIYKLKPFYQNLLYLESNKDNLSFITLLDDLQGLENYLLEKSTIDPILTKHRKTFPKTPKFEYFVDNDILRKEDEDFILNFRYGELDYWKGIGDRIASILYDKLNQNDTIDELVILKWLDRIYMNNYWPIDFCKYLNRYNKDAFIKTATNLVLKEEDIIMSNKELSKLVLDSKPSGMQGIINKEEIRFNFDLDWTYYAKLEELIRFDNCTQGCVLWHQESRIKLMFLIRCIILNDESLNTEGEHFANVFKLLEISHNSPYLIHQIYKGISEYRPEIIPYLIIDKTYGAYGLAMLRDLQLNEYLFESTDNHRVGLKISFHNTELLIDGFKLMLCNGTDSTTLSQHLFDCLKLVFQDKYISMNQLDRRCGHIRRLSEKDAKKILNVIPTIINDIHGKASRNISLIDALLIDIFEFLQNFKAPIARSNLIDIPFWKFDFAFWIIARLKSNHEKGVQELVDKVYSWIKEELSQFLHMDKIETQDCQTSEPTFKTVGWDSNQLGFELIPWDKLVIYLYEKHELDSFLSKHIPSFDCSNLEEYDKSYYGDFNRLQGNKIRFLLRIVLLAHQKVNLKHHELINLNISVTPLLASLRSFIKKIVLSYFVEDIHNDKADIFNEFYENETFTFIEYPLLNAVVQEMNLFPMSERKEVIKKFFEQSKDLLRMLDFYEGLVAIGDKAYIKELIEQIDLDKFLKNERLLSRIEDILIKSINTDELTTQAQIVLNYFEQITKTKKINDEKNELLLYHLKLLMAYRNRDNDEIEKIPLPTGNLGNSKSKILAEEKKIFFQALFDLERGEIEKAKKKYDGLIQRNPKNIQVAVNRFYSEIRLAEIRSDFDEKRTLYQNAIENWNYMRGKFSPDELSSYQETIELNELTVYSNLGNDKEFTEIWIKLTPNQIFKKDYIILRTEHLIKQKRDKDAIDFLKEAKDFHKLYNNTDPKFFDELFLKLEQGEVLDQLRRDYERIIALTDRELFQIVPNVVNPKKSIDEFILYELIGSINSLLNKVAIFKNNSHEDEYNDLIEVLMDARLGAWNRNIFAQRRIGHSDSEKDNVGEADLSQSIGLDTITYEALRFYDHKTNGTNWTRLEEHIKKSFNYDSSRSIYYLIVYYEQETHFAEIWQEYKKRIISIKFNDEVSLIEKEVEDITEQFLNSSSIKIGKTIHNSKAVMYHIFVNIKYKLNS